MKKALLIINSSASFGNYTYEESIAKTSIEELSKEKCKTISGIQLIAPDAWMITLSDGLPFLAAVLKTCEDAGFSYKILYLEEDQEFIEYPKK